MASPLPCSLLKPRVDGDHCTLLRNALVWTGEPDPEGKAAARPAFRGSVLLRGNLIEAVVPEGGSLPPQAAEAEVVDCGGRAVVPGLVEGHAHVSFEDMVCGTDCGDLPPEEAVLVTLRNCGRLLEAGFTSAFSAASARLRLDVAVRNWINKGHAPGPRLLAASPEICATGCLGDFSAAHQARESFGFVADGPEEIRRAVRLFVREGVDTVKLNIGGDLVPTSMLTAEKDDVMTCFTSEEVAACCQEAHSKQKRVAAHCRGSQDVVLALRHGVDVIYHLDFAHKDGDILKALEEAKGRIFVGPAVGLMDALAPGGIYAKGDGVPDVGVLLEAQKKTYAELRHRGIRVVIGGDYGFRATPQGTNANDLELFQQHFGFSAEEALVCGTRIGGELMGWRVGQLRQGWLADLLVVDGRPWENSSSLLATLTSDGEVCTPKIAAIVQDGHFHRKRLSSRCTDGDSASAQPAKKQRFREATAPVPA